jgi:hypothetical protein
MLSFVRRAVAFYAYGLKEFEARCKQPDILEERPSKAMIGVLGKGQS